MPGLDLGESLFRYYVSSVVALRMQGAAQYFLAACPGNINCFFC